MFREKGLKKILVLHRGQILKELISNFCDASDTQEDISIQVVLPDGRREKAVDDGGVLRDCQKPAGHRTHLQDRFQNKIVYYK